MNIIEAKQKAEILLNALLKIQRRSKKRYKKLEDMIKIVEAFLNCHITSSAIYRRYDELQEALKNCEYTC